MRNLQSEQRAILSACQAYCKVPACRVSAVLINTSRRLKLLINVFNSDGNEAMHHKEKRMIIHNKLHGEFHMDCWYGVVLWCDTPNTTLQITT
jgi:hypothetical protein